MRPRSTESTPREFVEEADRAVRDGDFGHLSLLGHEAQWFPWARQGLIVVGERELQKPGKRLEAPQPPHVLLFTGHRLDAPGRATPRFPASAEGQARRLIADAVVQQLARAPDGPWLGVAGAASGGDILFQEVCAELSIGTEVLLAGPRDEYVAASVSDAGPEWVRRFDAACARARQVRLLGPSLELPAWVRGREGYSVWERNNLWTLFHALRDGAERVTLISLWNGEGGDGPGGTADMVRLAGQRGAAHVRLDAKQLLRP